MRIVMMVDLDYFYARVEENRRPELKGKPVVVGMYSGRTETSGAVATCNYEARKYGVRSGIPLFRAKALLKDAPNAVFLHPDFDEYERVSNNVMEILRKHAEKFEQVSIDEAFLDVSDACKSYGEAEKLAKQIKHEILKQENVTCSVGIGPNKVVAKMASKLQKPDGLTVVRAEEFAKTFGDKPVRELYGIGPKTVEKLAEIDVESIGELAQTGLKQLQSIFGEKLGAYFHNAARGVDEEAVEEKEQKQFGRIVTLKKNARNVKDFEDVIDELSKDVVRMCAEKGFEFKNVGLFAVMEDMENVTRSRTLDDFATDWKLVASVTKELYENLLKDSSKSIRRAGVRVATLRKKGEGLKKFFKG